MKTSTSSAWAEHELRFADLGDRRLNRRLVRLVSDLAAQPEASVPLACGSWAATKAAYRFWDNDRVDSQDLYQAYAQSTQDRLPAPDQPLLAIQDTTSLNFSHHPATAGLGYFTAPEQRGLLVHSLLCADADGVPLGLLHQHVWVRDPKDFGKRQRRRRQPTAAKESQRWLDGLAATERALPGRRVITLADREADFYDLFAAPRQPGHELLIRAKSRRRIRQEAGLLSRGIAACPAGGQVTVRLPRADGRPGRTATLTLRWGTFAIAPPSTHPRRAQLPPLPLTAVRAQEENPPPGVKPVHWLLVSTLAVAEATDAARLVRWYTRRWLIERYNFVLKSGCRLEALQLTHGDRLRRALATYAVVAWRLLWLTYAARQHGDRAAAEVLTPAEEQVLQQHFGRPAEEGPLSLREAVRWIARLGGFLARRRDEAPGVQVLWRGLRRLEDLARGWQLALSQHDPPLVGNA
jgi:hypothetical protein